MLVVMYRSEARRGARWWVVCDDDSFVFVVRLVRVLSMLNASEPLLVGGGRARAPLCGNGLCHYKNWTEQQGHPPSVKHHAGGPAYVLSDAAMRRVVHGLRHQLCFDAPYGDTAVGACARAVGVRLLLLPEGYVVNNANRQTLEFESFKGQLVTYHRLSLRRRLCWARYGECDARCACPCECGLQRCSVPVDSKVRQRVEAQGQKLWQNLSKKERGAAMHAALHVVWNCSQHFDCTAEDNEWTPGNSGDGEQQRGRRAGDAGGVVGARGSAHVHVRVCSAAQSGGGCSSAACSIAVARLAKRGAEIDPLARPTSLRRWPSSCTPRQQIEVRPPARP